MKVQNPLTLMFTRPSLFILAIAAITSFASSANEQDSANYSMAVFVDAPYGEELLVGNYERVIADLGRENHSRKREFNASNNLCVAYSLAQDMDNAKAFCNKAVISSRRDLRRNSGGNTPNYRKQLAMALSNRGVIAALEGNTSDAKRDFEAAIRLRTWMEEPVHNLERLESKIQVALASL